jgi:ornithine--oxo-acid transaminase
MDPAIIAQEKKYCAKNYASLPVVLTRGKGIYVWDHRGKRYIDMMSAYSAASHGHCHPRLVKVIKEQSKQLTIVSRAYYTDKLAPFLESICLLSGYKAAMPMNTGAEAVETAIKAARKWAYTKKGVKKNQAQIIACKGNFHGRTTTIVGLSSEKAYKEDFGPYSPKLTTIPYGDPEALAQAITPDTAAFLLEPIQGEGGIIIPPAGYLKACARICKKNKVLLIIDEIQTGLGRTGKLFACQYDRIKPDGLLLGKALGGGMYPVSAFLADKTIMDVFTPGSHGSTFGGNPLGAAIAKEALDILIDEKLADNAYTLGRYFISALKKIKHPAIKEVRGKGLMIGIELDPKRACARQACLKLMDNGLLSKETHETVIRLAPPLVITKQDIDKALLIIKTTFDALDPVDA